MFFKKKEILQKAKNQMRMHVKNDIISKVKIKYYKYKGANIEKNTIIKFKARLLRYFNNISIGSDVIIKEYAEICCCNKYANISIGKNTSIGNYTFIYASKSIEIGDDCMIAPFCYLVDSNHGTSSITKMNRQENITNPIKIGNDVWIGAKSIILPGIKIGNGVVIAGGAVVTSDLDSMGIYGGVPAKKLNMRK